MPPLVRLLAKRLGTSFIVLIGVSLLIFAIARVIPGDPRPDWSDHQGGPIPAHLFRPG